MRQTANACMAAGGRFDQCSNWVKYGLIFPPPKQHGRGRGSISIWPFDTAERVSIIKDRLASGYKLLDIAYELFVLGYTLNPRLIRQVLLKDIDEEENAKGRRLHTPRVYHEANLASGHEPNEQDEAQERQHISRSLKRKTPWLSKASQTALIDYSYAMHGVSSVQSRKRMPDYASWATLRHALKHVDDLTLLQASIDAITYLNAHEAETEQVRAVLGLTPAQAAHWLLPCYRGKQALTQQQALRPSLTILSACFPNWEQDYAEHDQQAGWSRLIRLIYEMKAAGRGWFSGS